MTEASYTYSEVGEGCNAQVVACHNVLMSNHNALCRFKSYYTGSNHSIYLLVFLLNYLHIGAYMYCTYAITRYVISDITIC